MTPLTVHSPHARITQLGSIVRSLRGLGLDIPDDVEAELKLSETHRATAGDAATALRVARNNLDYVPADEFDSALAEFEKASIRALTTQNEDAEIIYNVIASRLESAVLRHYDEWIELTAHGYNKVVESNDLNKHGRNLPDLTAKHLRVLDLSSTHTLAIEAWKASEPELSRYWGVYSRLARLTGHQIGAQGADSAGENMWLACVLGEASWSQAESAAVVLASIAAGSDASVEIANLTPHIIPSVVGYDLSLTTPEGASNRRSQIQPSVVNGYTPALAGISYQ